MITCPNCHKKIDDDSKFCPYCGKAVIAAGITPQRTAWPSEETAPGDTSAASKGGRVALLISISLILGIIGLVLILVVAPEQSSQNAPDGFPRAAIDYVDGEFCGERDGLPYCRGLEITRTEEMQVSNSVRNNGIDELWCFEVTFDRRFIDDGTGGPWEEVFTGVVVYEEQGSVEGHWWSNCVTNAGCGCVPLMSDLE